MKIEAIAKGGVGHIVEEAGTRTAPLLWKRCCAHAAELDGLSHYMLSDLVNSMSFCRQWPTFVTSVH